MTTQSPIPHAVPLEEAVLGAIILDSSCYGVVSDVLRPESFFIASHGTIYQTIEKMAKNGHSVDLLTLPEQLKKDGELQNVGGVEYIVKLSNQVASAANIEYHARIIAQKHIQREVMRVTTEVSLQAASEQVDAFELLEQAEKSIYEIGNKSSQSKAVTIGKFADKALAELLQIKNSPDGLIGVPCGMTEVDRITGGWRKSDLIVLAARPGMGKTAFVLTAAYNAAAQFGKSVLVFSMEMSGSQLAGRILSSTTGINGHRLTMGKATDEEMSRVERSALELRQLPITIDDAPGQSVPQMRSAARRLKAQKGLDLVIVDYLQLAASGDKNSGNREQEVAAIARGLKSMAKELDVPVIALSQLSRAVETRAGDRRPSLADLRESGQIEQDADVIGFLWRPAYYGIKEHEKGNYPDGHTELMIRKFRGGPSPMDIPLHFDESTTTFSDPEQDMPDFSLPAPSASIPVDYSAPSRGNTDQDIPF